MPGCFLDNQALSQEPNLNRFIAEEIQPDDKFLRNCGEVVDTICRYLQGKCKEEWPQYSANKMVKGGSLGKGTALRGRSDVDVVLFLNGFQSLEHFQGNLQYLLKKLKEFMDSYSKLNPGYVRVDTITSRAVKFAIKCSPSSPEMDVDLLPSFVAGINSDLYKQLKALDHGDRAHSIFVDRQREFVGKQPPNVKSLIRLIKHWRYEYVPTGRGYPSSYAFELLAIHAWEQAGSRPKFDTVQAFRLVLEYLTSYEKLDVVWTEYYVNSDVDTSLRRGSKPVIIDPANPTVNVCKTSDKWSEVAAEARRSLNRPMLKKVEVKDLPGVYRSGHHGGV